MGMDILNEDTRVKLDFSNMELLNYDMDDRVLHNADNASAISFRSALGTEHMINNNQTDTEVPGMDLAAIAFTDGAMSSVDSA
jgi:hypothetical protein